MEIILTQSRSQLMRAYMDILNGGKELDVHGYQQQTNYTCGIAVIRSIIEYFGLSVPPEQKIAKIAGTSKKYGTLPQQIVNTLGKCGIQSRAKSSNIDELKQQIKLDKPAALLVTFEKEAHWMLLVEITNDLVELFDPYYDKSIYFTCDELNDIWQATINDKKFYNTVVIT